MPHSTLSMKLMRARPRKKGEAGSLENIDGIPLHVHVRQYVETLHGATIIDQKNKRYFKVEDLKRDGRAVTVLGEAGYFGEEGNTYRVADGELTHTKSDEEAATARVRTTIFVPPHADFAIAAIESRRGVPNGNLFIDRFLRDMRQRFDTMFFPIDTVLEKDAWSAAGNLKAIQVVKPKYQMNLSSGIDQGRDREQVEGNLTLTGMPPKGMKYWPKSIWDKIRNQELDAAVFLRAREEGEHADPDENVLVTIERDDRQKTFELGSDGKPSVREVLTTSGQALLDDDQFFKRAGDSVRGLYLDMDKAWEQSWFGGPWPDAWVAYRWATQ